MTQATGCRHLFQVSAEIECTDLPRALTDASICLDVEPFTKSNETSCSNMQWGFFLVVEEVKHK